MDSIRFTHFCTTSTTSILPLAAAATSGHNRRMCCCCSLKLPYQLKTLDCWRSFKGRISRIHVFKEFHVSKSQISLSGRRQIVVGEDDLSGTRVFIGFNSSPRLWGEKNSRDMQGGLKGLLGLDVKDSFLAEGKLVTN